MPANKKKLPFAIENEQEEQEECLNPHRPHKLPALYHIYTCTKVNTQCVLSNSKKKIIYYYILYAIQWPVKWSAVTVREVLLQFVCR